MEAHCMNAQEAPFLDNCQGLLRETREAGLSLVLGPTGRGSLELRQCGCPAHRQEALRRRLAGGLAGPPGFHYEKWGGQLPWAPLLGMKSEWPRQSRALQRERFLASIRRQSLALGRLLSLLPSGWQFLCFLRFQTFCSGSDLGLRKLVRDG